MSPIQATKSEPILSRRRLGVAGVAAAIGCAACCAAPLLAAAGIGGTVAATLSSAFRPGAELLVGGVGFALALAVMALRKRVQRAAGCGASWQVDGSRKRGAETGGA